MSGQSRIGTMFLVAALGTGVIAEMTHIHSLRKAFLQQTVQGSMTLGKFEPEDHEIIRQNFDHPDLKKVLAEEYCIADNLAIYQAVTDFLPKRYEDRMIGQSIAIMMACKNGEEIPNLLF